jgi:hypothetical protein
MCFIHMYTHFLQTNLLIHTEPLGVVQEWKRKDTVCGFPSLCKT